MCAGCAFTALTGATGARAWLQAHHGAWLTPRRLRAATVSLFVAALLVSSVGLGGASRAADTRAHSAQDVAHQPALHAGR